MNISNRIKITFFLFPFLLSLIFIFMKVYFPIDYESLIEEDSIIEYLQFIFYFVSFVLALFISIRFMQNKMPLQGILYIILTIGLFFVAFEEISWGQRIFNIATPSFFEARNLQNEISLHNTIKMSILHNIYIIVGAYGSFAWILAWFFLGSDSAKERYAHIIRPIVPDWFLSSYFLFLFFIYLLFEYIYSPRSWTFHVWRDQEIAELFLSLGFLSFVAINFTRLRESLIGNSLDKIKHSLRITKPNKKPSMGHVESWLGKDAYRYWLRIVALIKQMYPNIFSSEWFFGGRKDGWYLRYKKGKLFCCLIPEKNKCILMLPLDPEENAKVKLICNNLLPQTMKCFDEAETYNNEKRLFLSIDSEKVFNDAKRLFFLKRKPKQ